MNMSGRSSYQVKQLRHATCSVSDAQASPGSSSGGAINIANTAVGGTSVTLTYITFDTNVADSGGGLAVTSTTIVISDCYFIRNSAQASGTGRGGAILCEPLLLPLPDR